MKTVTRRPELESRKKIGLLVSVRNAREAILVSNNDVEILDVKEPANGPLGRPDAQMVQQVLSVIEESQVVSCALGELTQMIDFDPMRFFDECDPRQQISFAKIGLAGAADVKGWEKLWREMVDRFPAHVNPVAVAYVDRNLANSPQIDAVFRVGLEAGCRMFLLDTHCKSAGNFLRFGAVHEIAEFVLLVNSRGGQLVLAGSIDLSHINEIFQINPNYVGVRGAVCESGNREAVITEQSLSNFVSHFKQRMNVSDKIEID